MVPYKQNTCLQKQNSYMHLLYIRQIPTLSFNTDNALKWFATSERLSYHLCLRKTLYNCILHNESVKINSLSWYLMAQIVCCLHFAHNAKHEVITTDILSFLLSSSPQPTISCSLQGSQIFKSILQQVSPEGIQFSKQECQTEPRLHHHFIPETAL